MTAHNKDVVNFFWIRQRFCHTATTSHRGGWLKRLAPRTSLQRPSDKQILDKIVAAFKRSWGYIFTSPRTSKVVQVSSGKWRHPCNELSWYFNFSQSFDNYRSRLHTFWTWDGGCYNRFIKEKSVNLELSQSK